MNYTEFTARLQALMVTDAALDADFVTMLPSIIENAELRCYRDLTPLALLRTQSISIASGTYQIAMPSDFIAARSLVAVTGSNRVHLRKRDDRYLHAYWPDRSVTGTPKYWAEVSYGVLALAPPPAALTTLEMEYTQRPSTLSADNPTTWLASFAPDLLVYAAMCFIGGYQRAWGTDQKPGAFWEGEYQRALATLKLEEAQRRTTTDVPP